ncbi:MAG: LysM peptidoglycan-binding domain-containing protein [Anaerolineae bacterium]|nr:LysM peptidoglycan-binding domain-containing protein [Anaerolineae bacterium]
MHHVRRLITVVLVLTVLLSVPGLALGQGDGEQTKHIVKVGENLYRIALQYGTTVEAIVQANNITNPSMIFVGQELIIPGVAVQPTAEPTVDPAETPTVEPTVDPAETPTEEPSATPEPPTTPPPAGQEIVHVVQPGENLFRIALQYNLLTSIVATYNGIDNPNLIFVGQRIRIPTGGGATPSVAPATPAPADGDAETPAPDGDAGDAADADTPPPNTAGNVPFAYGVQVHLPNQDTAAVVGSATDLGVTWVKQQIEWALYEPTAGNVNWGPIDAMVNAMDAAGVNILLSVTSAPSWAREADQEKGPPTDNQTYANFVGQLAQRYAGVVDAYEVWNEPNLRREWNTPNGISAASYVELLRLAYAAIKNADPGAVVITGGLAPTGFNDGVNAIDDRVYLRQMYAAGVADWSDAIGAHPNGWANPPDSTCCRNNRPAVPGWDDHPSFFFKQTLSDYREIMVSNGDSGTYIWATEFGWGSNDGLNVEPAAEFGFVAFTSLDEQASYTLRGFQLGRELGYVGPMILWNLNFCPVVGQTGEQCLWGLLDPAGNPRPAYLALRDMAQ